MLPLFMLSIAALFIVALGVRRVLGAEPENGSVSSDESEDDFRPVQADASDDSSYDLDHRSTWDDLDSGDEFEVQSGASDDSDDDVEPVQATDDALNCSTEDGSVSPNMTVESEVQADASDDSSYDLDQSFFGDDLDSGDEFEVQSGVSDDSNADAEPVQGIDDANCCPTEDDFVPSNESKTIR